MTRTIVQATNLVKRDILVHAEWVRIREGCKL